MLMMKPHVIKRARVGDVIEIPRRRGLWVVERAEMEGGGYAMGTDYYEDALHVTARKLNSKGGYNRYDKHGRALTFTMDTRSYNTCIDGIVIHGRMEQCFV
jgi:hypothetical protein